DWKPDPDRLRKSAREIAARARRRLTRDGFSDGVAVRRPNGRSHELRSLEADREKLLVSNSISPVPLHKALVLLDCLEESDGGLRSHQLLALAKVVVAVSNLRFKPEVQVK